jgi:polyphosphate kinase 2 (PPK2 family)
MTGGWQNVAAQVWHGLGGAKAVNLSDFESGAPYPGDYDKDIADLQKRLAHLSVANHVHGRTALIVCEGWDAAGKGGAIQRITAEIDPRDFICAVGQPAKA